MSEYLEDYTDLLGSPNRTRLYEFIIDSFRRVSPVYTGILFFGLLISIGVYLVTQNSFYNAIWPNQIVYYLVLIYHVFYRLKNNRANILSPDMLFLVFYTIVHLGYVTLYSLNLVPQTNRVFYYEESIPRAMFVINLGLFGFLFGYELMGLRAPFMTSLPPIRTPRAAWEIVAIILMVLATCMHFLGLSRLGWDWVMREGYGAIMAAPQYATFLTVLLLSFSTLVMAAAVTIYIIASALRHGKMFYSKIALFLTVFYFVIVTLEGSRSSMLLFGVPLLLVRHFYIKRLRLYSLVLLFIATMALFSALALVRTSALQPGKMLQEYRYEKAADERGWRAPFVELGGSFLVVSIVTQDVPTREPYWLGASWRDAALHIVPFLQGAISRLGYGRLAPSTWITYTYFGYGAAGRGFTVAAEGYLNFGFAGAFVELLLVGMFIRWLMLFFSRRPSAMRAIIFVGCLGRAVLLTRNHSNGLLAPCAQIFVLTWLLNIILGNEPMADEFTMSEYGETSWPTLMIPDNKRR